MKNYFIKNLAVTFFGLLTVLLCSNFKILEDGEKGKDKIAVKCATSCRDFYCHAKGEMKSGCANTTTEATCGTVGGSSSGSTISILEEL